jgi:hypothetical protein
MTEKEIRITFIAITLMMIAVIVELTCNKPQNIALQQKKSVTEYKRKLLTDKLNVLKDFDTIYVNRWRNVKGETKSFFDTVYVTAPDTCDKWIIMCENRLYLERQIADSLIQIKDSTILTQHLIIKEDSVLLQVSKDELTASRDSTKKAKRKGFVKGFVWGFGTASVISQLIK